MKDGVLVLCQPATLPTEANKARKNYCVYHQLVKYPAKDCWALRNIFHQKIADGELQITTRPEKDRATHGKGKVVNVASHRHHGKGMSAYVTELDEISPLVNMCPY